ncbi:MAG: energy-coupling factor transporter transmembrane protein EcfT [Lachnospiraceae bacterium]|nr:energy-coupling factor transporter transmembrane protein EcfT [Lachnospiraceae bacterium]
MVRDMTIGQFYNADSVIHRLDPRVKITIAMIYVISLFFDQNPVLYMVCFAVLLGYIRLSRVPLRFILRGIKALGMVILLTVVLNLFTVQGAETLFEWGFLRITTVGVESAIYLGLKLVMMIIGSGMMTYTTTPNALTDGLEGMLGWMKRLSVPVHEFAMIMSIALRFVPILLEEMDRIMKAQMARGIDFKEGNLFIRLRKLMPILIPLLVSAVRRSNELALAMDARCYHGGEGRTKMNPLIYRREDYIAYIFVIIYLAGTIFLAVKC